MSAQVAVPVERQKCTIHGAHGSALPLRTVGHHILPKEWGGDPHGELAWVCDNGHYSIHRILDWLRLQDRGPKGDGVGGLPYDEVIQMRPPFGGSRSELRLAREGYERWVSVGRLK
jgi:hypothetical protein